jgi:PAS domain S-box-containing protein
MDKTMNDEEKRREELIDELAEIRQRMAELNKSAIQNKLAEGELIKSEERYRSLVELSPDMIALHSRGKYVYMNPAGIKLLGASGQADLIGKSIFKIIHPDCIDIVRERIGQLEQEKAVPLVEEKFIRPDGTIVDVEVAAAPIFFQGEPMVQVIARDITKRKQAEEALRKSKEEATRLAKEAEVLARIGRIISSTLRIEEVYDRFAEEVSKLIPLDRICISLVKPEAGMTENVYVWGVKVGDRKAGNSYPLTGSIGEEIIRTRKSLLVQTEDQDELIRHSPHLLTTFQAGLRSMLSVPLISQDQVIGILHIRSLRINAYTGKEVKLAEEVGNQIAGAIASASLYGELKEAKETLQKREEEFRELYDHAPLGYHEYNREGKITRVNKTDLEMLGYTAEEMIGQPMWKFNFEEEFAKKQILAKLAGRLPPGSNLVRTYRRKDGSTFPVLIEDRLLKDGRGQIIGIRCTIQDITKRKRAEEAQRKSEEEATRLAEKSAVMAEIGQIISSTLNIEEVYKLFSAKVKSLIPYDRITINLISKDGDFLTDRYVEGESVPGRNIGDIFSRAGTLTEAMILNRRGLMIDSQDENEIAVKYPGLLPELRAGYRSFLSIPLISGDQPIGGLHFRSKGHRVYSEKDLNLAESIANQIAGAIASAQLFFEHERTEKEKASLQQQLHQSQKMEAIGNLAGGIAHDFNNLLTIINTNAQLTLTELKDWDPLKERLESIHKAGERAVNLTRQLLALSRRQVVDMKVIDLNSLLQELGKMLVRVIGEDIALSTIMAKDLGRVKADPGQIEQVILNLVVNARDAMPSGGKLAIETANVELDREYTHTHLVVKPGRYVMLSVSDTGVGMSPEVRERVFEPFFTTKEKGTGLGLSTVYGVVKQSGGYIWAYSEPGRGSTFKIYLPQVDEPLGEEIRKKVVKGMLPGGKETILVAEDEEEVRKLAVDILRKQGYRILEAPHGGDAFLICEQGKEPVDLLLTDVVMPGLNGPELARRLKYFYPEMKVLFMSGYTDNTIFQQGVLDQGMFFLQKPFSVEGLAAKVREVLDN